MKLLSDDFEEESTEKLGVFEEDGVDFDLGCGESREANEVEKRGEKEAVFDVVESKIGNGPPPVMDTNGDIFSGRD